MPLITLDLATVAALRRYGEQESLSLTETIACVIFRERALAIAPAGWESPAQGVYTQPMRSLSTDRDKGDVEHAGMPTTLRVDDETFALVRFAARLFGVTEGEVVARAVRQLSEEAEQAEQAFDPWTPVDVYGEYDGQIVTGQYLPATKRLNVTSEPIAGASFKSPSGAARAVVAALNPERSATQTNGWRFWHLASTHERLEVLR